MVEVGHQFFVFMERRKRLFFSIKRSLDILVSLIGLILIGPLCMVLCMTNLIFLGRPLFFRQQRIGFQGRIFWILKFRSLPHHTHPDQIVISPYGRFIRKWSLDELPSIFNILKGDISLVGPRPLIVDFFCPPWRNHVRPGMTGLAQIRGRNDIGWREKFRYDLFYIRHASFSLDLYILWKTIPLLFSTRGTDIPSLGDYFPDPKDDCAKPYKP